jgi:cytochrome c peroxidase
MMHPFIKPALAVFFLSFGPVAYCIEPILPIPQSIEYDRTKALLGKRLFTDTNLSSDKKVSCATCHQLDDGGADNRPVSPGVNRQMGAVNAPTVFNSFFNFRQFWDGRAKNLRDQAAGPLHNPAEMNFGADKVVKHLNSQPDYVKEFRTTFNNETIEFGHVLDAIAEFEKALYTPNARFDRYLRGEIELTTNEHEGYLLFKRLGCAACHNGVNVGGNSYQYMGVVEPYEEKLTGDLYGRTGDTFDRNRYKVPSLRNITETAPYMHTGGVKTLRAMVNTMAKYNIGLRLTEQETDRIIAFLSTLTGERPAILTTP